MTKYDYLLILIYVGLVITVTFLGTKKKKKRFRFFLLNFFLTPIAGVYVYLRKKEKDFRVSKSRYIVTRYKCDNCGYKFDEPYECCPICEKAGFKIALEEVKQIMT